MKIKSLVKNISIVFMLSILASCNNRIDNIKLVYERFNTELIFPPSIYPSNKKSMSTLKELCHKKIKKTVILVDGDCGACVGEFILWNDFKKKNENLFRNCSLIYIVKTSNISRFEYITEKAGINFTYYIDTLDQYCKLNNINHPALNTILVDENNKIKQIGSPVRNRKIEKLYRKFLTEIPVRY